MAKRLVAVGVRRDIKHLQEVGGYPLKSHPSGYRQHQAKGDFTFLTALKHGVPGEDFMAQEPGNNETRHLNMPDTDTYTSVRATTGPLDEALPWVIEFRVVGTAFTIQAQVHEAMIIGRSDPQRGIFPTVDLEPYGARTNGVSRQHAVITVNDSRIKIRDLGSVNGTRLNGYSLVAHQDYRLRHGDDLEIGQVKLQVRFAVVPTIDAPADNTAGDHASLPVVGRNEHILIVEDDADVAKVFSIALKHSGFRVTVMENASAALAFLSHEMPDGIILDLMLPDMNGLDLVRFVRRQPNGKSVPLIICSGATGGFQMNQAKEAGANLFLGKPVTVDELVRSMATVLHGEPVEDTTKMVSS